ncbi:DUF4219 domain-containing protein [Tanacetum coccineum]
MPFSTYTNLGLGILSHTRLTIELADRTMKQPRGIAKNVLVRIGKFIFPIDFIILDIPEDDDVPLILGRPFLSTARSKIDVFKRKFTLRVGEEKLVFKSVKPATSIFKRVFMLRDLDSKTKLKGEDLMNHSTRFMIREVLDHCNNVVPELTFGKTIVIINKEMPRLVNLAVNKDREVDPINAQEMISKEFATHEPKMIEELFRKHMQNKTLNLSHPD